MSDSLAIIGKGTTLGHATTSGGSYTTVSEVIDVNFPEPEAADVETSHYTTANGINEYMPGWVEGGDVEFEVNYNKVEYPLLQAIFKTKLYWKITLPDASTLIFHGYINKLGGPIPNKDRVTNKIKIKVLDIPAFVAGA